jgi:multiple antibiotic resistance protein
MPMTHGLFQDFVLLLVAVNPFLMVPEFLIVTTKHTAREKRRIAVEAVLIAAGVLLVFLALGQIVLDEMGVELHAFQIAAGLILLLMSIRMVLEETLHHGRGGGKNPAVHPLAIPYIAGPKSIVTVMLLTDNAVYSVADQMTVGILLLIVLAITLGCLLVARRLHMWFHDTGVNIVTRVMGLILAALAVQYMLNGLGAAFRPG